MSKIKILDKSITNRISAGEVVEKPASIVKELLENSIDAGAKRIVVEIINGGIEKIAITDDGSGIAKDDIALTIMPHATSKISSISDLDAIQTLGFRGEALASIASVSRLEIISKTAQQELGQKLSANGGDIVSQTEIACPTGTHIEVNSLFFNTPVRAKFLRKPKTEQADITDYMERIMLAYPHIAFKYIIDGKIKYNTTSASLKDVIYTIYGSEVVEGLIEVNHTFDAYSVNGFIGTPEIAKPNRNYQTLLISGRYVKNFMVSSAVATAYDTFLMKNKFPFFVLNLSLPADNVDVNVHPNKLEVKFEKPNKVYTAFHHAVLNALMLKDQTKQINLQATTKQNDTEQQTNQQESKKINLTELESGFGVSYKQEQEPTQEQTNIFQGLKTNLNDQNIADSKVGFDKSTIANRINVKQVAVSAVETHDNLDASLNQQESEAENSSEHEKQTDNNSKPQQQFEVTEFKIIGTMFNTYNIIQAEAFVYFIDQHAAHERILYDKYINELNQNSVMQQQLLIPHILQVKDVESAFLNQYINVLTNAGFMIEEFGFNTYKVSAVPYVFASMNISAFFNQLLADLNNYQKQPNDYLKDKIATMACKSAVKAGQSLSELEIKTIFKTMQNGILHCPHGRPFVLKLDKLQVEKWFKRVL